MEKKYILILMGLIGVIFWSYPSTLALFTNDHAFYNDSASCTKCHGDIQTQLEDTGRATQLHATLDTDFGCKACHSNTNNTFGRNYTKDYHSAYSPECIECHTNSATLYGSQEAHTLIVTGAATSTLTAGINEACMMCHTTMYGSVTVRNRQVFAFENDSIASNTSPIYDGSYTTTFQNTRYSGKHNFQDDAQCIYCHMPVYEILNQSTDPYPEHMAFGCIGCHRGSGMTVGQTNETSLEYHAAKTKYCSDCHGQVSYPRDCNRCHLSHGGFKS